MSSLKSVFFSCFFSLSGNLTSSGCFYFLCRLCVGGYVSNPCILVWFIFTLGLAIVLLLEEAAVRLFSGGRIYRGLSSICIQMSCKTYFYSFGFEESTAVCLIFPDRTKNLIKILKTQALRNWIAGQSHCCLKLTWEYLSILPPSLQFNYETSDGFPQV